MMLIFFLLFMLGQLLKTTEKSCVKFFTVRKHNMLS